MHLVTALLYSGKGIGFIPGCLLYIIDAVMKYWCIYKYMQHPLINNWATGNYVES